MSTSYPYECGTEWRYSLRYCLEASEEPLDNLWRAIKSQHNLLENLDTLAKYLNREFRADVHDQVYFTAMQMASQNGCRLVFKKLVSVAGVNFKCRTHSRCGEMPFFLWVYAQKDTVSSFFLKYAINHGDLVLVDGCGQSILHYAAKAVDIAGIKHFLDLGAEPHQRDCSGRLAIDYPRSKLFAISKSLLQPTYKHIWEEIEDALSAKANKTELNCKRTQEQRFCVGLDSDCKMSCMQGERNNDCLL